MEEQIKLPAFSFSITLDAKELWKFSMYHANKGYLGVFNVLFTIAAVYLLITQWAVVSLSLIHIWYRGNGRQKSSRSGDGIRDYRIRCGRDFREK